MKNDRNETRTHQLKGNVNKRKLNFQNKEWKNT